MAKKTAKKSTRTAAKSPQKEDLMVKKLNKILLDSESSISEVKFKPKETVQKLNDLLAKSGLKDMEVESLKLGAVNKVCKRYKAVKDSNGNIIGLDCVEWV